MVLQIPEVPSAVRPTVYFVFVRSAQAILATLAFNSSIRTRLFSE